MKREVMTMTHRQWKKALEAGNKAVEGIPENHNRVRAHAKADAIASYISAHAKMTEIDATGRDCIYACNENLGSRKWSDLVTTYTAGKVLKVYKSTFLTSAAIGRVSNVVVLYR